MDINAAVSMARGLMVKHGVGYMNFSFHTDLTAGPYTIGKCHYMVNEIGGKNYYTASAITVGIEWIKVMDEGEVREVILHEIAHALAGHGTGHGPVWEGKCRQLGIIPNVKCKTKNVPAGLKTWELV